MSQKDDSLPKLLNFERAKLAKNRHKISEIANFTQLNLRQLATELSQCIENLFFSLRRWLFRTIDILR